MGRRDRRRVGHFVALGIFAYERGGAASVGVAGLVRLLPAAILAPFAASVGDRFRRERFLFGLTLVGAAALAASAVAARRTTSCSCSSSPALSASPRR